ncbi:MAG: hypothetical protein KJ645_01020 [Planctomycetes bacterium]|nr:hypothetical protein [Planctomycetota bacterium]
MLHEILQRKSLFCLLHRLDEYLARESRKGDCPFCGGPLYQSNYQRKPRGEMEPLPDEYLLRHSNCCGREGCRRRVLPPSVKFLGRKIYWGCIHLVAMALRQRRPGGWTAHQVMLILGIPAKTLSRWARYWREAFPATAQWKRLRGQVPPTVGDTGLPGALLDLFLREKSTEEEALVGCLRFLATG